MTKIHVIGHRDALDRTLSCLQARRAVHLLDVTGDPSVNLPPLAVDEAHRREFEEVRSLKTRLDATLALAPHPPVATGSALRPDLVVLRQELEEARPEIEQLVHELDELGVDQETYPRYIASLRRLLPLVPDLTRLRDYETTALLVERRYRDVLGQLNVALSDVLGTNFEIISDQVDADTVGAVLVYPRSQADRVQSLLGHEQLTRVRLPPRYEHVPFREALAEMERHAADIPPRIADAEEALDARIRAYPDWAAAARYLARRLDQLNALGGMGATPHTFVISGWTPRAGLADLSSALATEVGDRVIIQDAGVEHGETPPVLMHNPGAARPFEFLVRLLSLPRYGTLDPTRLMMLFMPLFFGIMLGDVAYGAALFAIAFAVHRRYRARSAVAGDLSLIFLHAAVWAVAWGVVYGEFLGDLGARWFGMEPLWINREEALEPLLIFAVAVGAAHMTLALVLGIYEAIRLRSRHQAVERAALLAALAGLFLMAGAATEQLPAGIMTPAVATVVVSLVVMMSIGGALGILLGPLELLGTIGNVLSYLRLAAIGLASVFLAKVANELGAAAPLWLGLIVASLFHALNLALGAFSPAIQALRLHYVEFFGKFYEEGGEAFTPFGAEAGLDHPTATAA